MERDKIKYNYFISKDYKINNLNDNKFFLKINKYGINYFSLFLFWLGEDCFLIIFLK